MSNDYYNPSAAPATSSNLSSATMRAEFAAIGGAMDKLAPLSGNGDEVVVINSGATGQTSTTKATLLGETMTAATAKTTPVDADTLPLTDSEASNILKKLTWANLKATIKAYYDAVTSTLTNKTLNLTSNTLVATSAQLAAAVTDETGTGALVFANAPALTSPTGLVKADVGLSNVDNTSDANKPISTAAQSALDAKAPLASPTFTGTVSGITAAMVGAPSGSGTSTGTNTGDQTNISGNAATATLAGNSSQLLGATWEAPSAIGSTTPAAGSFTALNATTFTQSNRIDSSFTIPDGQNALTIGPFEVSPDVTVAGLGNSTWRGL